MSLYKMSHMNKCVCVCAEPYTIGFKRNLTKIECSKYHVEKVCIYGLLP